MFEYPAGGPLYEGKHLPIITKELYNIVRNRMESLVPDKPAWGSKQFPFKHLLYCGSCGSRFTAKEHFKKLKDGGRTRYVYYRCTKSTKDPNCAERSITAGMITEQIPVMTDTGEFDDIEPTEQLFTKIEQYKRVTSQLIKDYGIETSDRAHFKKLCELCTKTRNAE